MIRVSCSNLSVNMVNYQVMRLLLILRYLSSWTGQVAMEKVKVSRYVSGKRPNYAPRSSSEEESDDEEFMGPPKKEREEEEYLEDEGPRHDFTEVEKLDPRLKRLMAASSSSRRK